MLRFGMPTLIETETIADCAALCHDLRLDFIELNMNLPQYQPHAINPHALNRLAEQYEISYTIHLDENLNISDFNLHVAEAYRRTVLETIELAKAIHAPLLNMHLSRGVYFTLPDQKVFLFDRYRDLYLRSMESFRDACTKAVGSSGIRVCVENSSGYLPIQIEALNYLLKSPAFGLTLDTGHNHCTGGEDENVILQYPDRLYHMHLHDAAGKKDHLVPGDGEVDLHRYLRLAENRSCSVVLETKTIAGLRRTVEWLKNARA